MMHKLKWDDLQIIVAVAQSGSANRAAAALGLNHATVIRRLDGFEKQHGVTLFDRQPTGMRPTQACEALIGAAGPIEDAILEIRQNILGQDLKLAGTIRLTTTDSIAQGLVIGALAKFRELHPEITVDLTATTARLDLVRLDADLSVRPSRDPPKQLVGRNVAPMAFAAYASRARPPVAADPFAPNATWIGVHHDLANSPVAAWMTATLAGNPIAARADSFIVARELAAAGLGNAILPCFVGDLDTRLVRRTEPLHELGMTVWVLTPERLGRSARVRALSNHLVRTLKQQRRLLAGDAAND